MITSLTILNRNECRTVEELRNMRRQEGKPVIHWARIAAQFAAQHGYVVAWLADDTMIEFRRDFFTRKVSRKTHGRNWRFSNMSATVWADR